MSPWFYRASQRWPKIRCRKYITFYGRVGGRLLYTMLMIVPHSTCHIYISKQKLEEGMGPSNSVVSCDNHNNAMEDHMKQSAILIQISLGESSNNAVIEV